MPRILQLVLLILLAVPLTGFGQQIYKCENAGVLVFSDEECGEDAEKLTNEDLQANISIVEFVRGNYDPDAWKAAYRKGAQPASASGPPGRYVRLPNDSVVYVENDNRPAHTSNFAPNYAPIYANRGYGFYPGKRDQRPTEPEPEPAPPFRKDLRTRDVAQQPRPQQNSNDHRQPKSLKPD